MNHLHSSFDITNEFEVTLEDRNLTDDLLQYGKNSLLQVFNHFGTMKSMSESEFFTFCQTSTIISEYATAIDILDAFAAFQVNGESFTFSYLFFIFLNDIY